MREGRITTFLEIQLLSLWIPPWSKL